MITVITGTPGAGKTALAVDLICKEYKDRLLYVDNLEGLVLEHQEIDVLDWMNQVPDGGLIVCDEIQRKWRPRGPGAKVPESISALETHRHRGIDFILITQNVKLIDANVRALVGRHLHIRDTGWMGRWLYEFPECDPNNSWKRCENKRRYKLPKHVFDKYKSASLHTKPVRTRPMMLYFIGAALLGLLYLAFSLYTTFQGDKQTPTGAPPAPASSPMQIPTPEGISKSVMAGLVPLEPQGQQQKKIDDRVDWIPRVPTMPESAPAYDEVRKVQTFPLVVGGLCFKGECKCFTQQGTDSGLSHNECVDFMKSPRFNAYRVTESAPQHQQPASRDYELEVEHAVARRLNRDRQEFHSLVAQNN